MKNILIAIDFSEVTAQVVDLARTIAQSLGADVHLVHVKEPGSVPPIGAMGYGVMGMPELMPTSGLAVPVLEPMPEPLPSVQAQTLKLKEWQNELAQAGVKSTLHEPTGGTVDEILKTVDAVHADLIVMGRHGYSAMYNLLVGSVTEGVLKRASCPVLLVPGSRS